MTNSQRALRRNIISKYLARESVIGRVFWKTVECWYSGVGGRLEKRRAPHLIAFQRQTKPTWSRCVLSARTFSSPRRTVRSNKKGRRGRSEISSRVQVHRDSPIAPTPSSWFQRVLLGIIPQLVRCVSGAHKHALLISVLPCMRLVSQCA